MSTKCTIAHGDSFHFYREVMDDDHVYLEMKDVQFEASHGRVMVPIPIHVWEAIRHLGGAEPDLVERTDEELLKMVEENVDRRIEEYAAAERERPRGGGLARVAGLLVYDTADRPREQQIESGMAYFKKERARQMKLRAAITALSSPLA